MDENWFFKTVWRFNALALASILILGAAVVGWELFFSKFLKTRHANEVVNIDQADNTLIETEALSVVEKVKGFGLFRVDLHKKQKYRQQYASKKTAQTLVNTGIFDPQTGQTEWLFSASKQLITGVTALYMELEDANGKTHSIVENYLVTYTNKDTSGDQRLSDSDEKSILAAKPNGAEKKVILTGLKSNPVIMPAENGTHIIFFKTQKGQRARVFDAKTMSVGAIQTISSP